MAKTHSEAPFTPDRMKLILASAGDGLKAVGMTSMDQAPAVLVHAVDDYVFNWQQGKLAKEKMIDPEDAPFALGTLWGEQLVRQFGWQWATITFHQHKDSKAPAVLSPDRSLFHRPHSLHHGVPSESRRGHLHRAFVQHAKGRQNKRS